MCLFIDMIYWVYSNNFQKFHPTFEYEFVFDEKHILFHIFCHNLITIIKPLNIQEMKVTSTLIEILYMNVFKSCQTSL